MPHQRRKQRKPKVWFEPADAHTLQLDIDDGNSLQFFYKQLPWFSCICNEHSYGLRAISITHSRSGVNWHVEIKLSKRLKLVERIAWQAILGSDRSRELCNLERVMCRSAYPVLFIKQLGGVKQICRQKTPSQSAPVGLQVLSRTKQGAHAINRRALGLAKN